MDREQLFAGKLIVVELTKHKNHRYKPVAVVFFLANNDQTMDLI